MPPLLPTVSDGHGRRTFSTLPCLAAFSNPHDSDCDHHPQLPSMDAKHTASAKSGRKRRSATAPGVAASRKRRIKKRLADVRDTKARPWHGLLAIERLIQNEDVWSQILRFADKKTLSSCCLLNRQICRLARSELWRHITLGFWELRYLHFVGELPQALLDHTFYLTLVLTDLGWLEPSETGSLESDVPFDQARAANNCLHTFSRLIGRAKRIRSFSLRVVTEDGPCADFVLRQQVLSDIVNALPATCTSIEIDTHGLDDGSMLVDDNLYRQAGAQKSMDDHHRVMNYGLYDYTDPLNNGDPQATYGENVAVFEDESWEDATCLCSAVRKRLFQLQHLRLRLRSYCQQLLSSPIRDSLLKTSIETLRGTSLSPQISMTMSYPNLKSVVLNDVIQTHHWPSGRLMTRPIINHGFASTGQRPLREIVHLSHSHGVFPNATTLRHLSFHPTGNVTTLERSIANGPSKYEAFPWPSQVTLHQYRQSDLVTGRTRILPTSRPYRPGKVPFVTKVVTEPFVFEHTATPTDTKGRYDTRESTESYLEGDIWATTTRGTRVPFAVLSELDHPVLPPQRPEAPPQNDWKKMHHVLRNERAMGDDLHEVEEISVLTPKVDDEEFDETPLEMTGWRLKPKTLDLVPTRVP